MSRGVVRAALFAGAVVLAALALQSPPPKFAERRASARLGPWFKSDTLDRGESLSALLGRIGLSDSATADALDAASEHLDDRRIPAGLSVEVRGDSNERAPSDILLRLSGERRLRLVRAPDGHWTAREEAVPWEVDTIVVHAEVRSTLYEALDVGAADLLSRRARAELAWELADIYEYRVDMSRDLQVGDSVRVVFERRRSGEGEVRIGPIVAAGLERSGKEMQAFRRLDERGRAQFYDGEGRSMRASFLRAPLSFRRISSVFGMRKHPILGIWRAHRGTDYSAASGTPIRSIGDGTVAFAGRRSGYGNTLEIRHPNGFLSRYGHLRGFARGVRAGTRVTMGQTVGYVGATGLATAPHLHFEILVGGVQRDPRSALRQNAGAPLAAGERAAFDARRTALLPLLAAPNGPVHPPPAQ
ncbi:MAG: M23 family metallopeptidase [Gemmatimonadaceae bacterium]|nr:M23 family metallopeptidase [Gemmatimonadaceae bacterium]